MKLCNTCGNEIPANAWKCPFCEEQQTAIAPGRRSQRTRCVTVNIKEGQPTVEEALIRMERQIMNASRGNTGIIRLIHGWGSSGAGGEIKRAAHKRLTALQRANTIKRFTPGDDYSKSTTAGRDLLRRHPELKNQIHTDRQNPGITFVEL